MATKINPADRARLIIDAAGRLGWRIHVHGSIFTITKQFTPGSREEFVQCDGEYYSVLGLLPRSSAGSDWGTDGGGIGGYSAMLHGCFTMNRSGGNKLVLKRLAEMLR